MYLSLSSRSHLRLSLVRDVRASSHTAGKLEEEQKFCVTAIVSSRLSTVCHQSVGTKMVSPGPVMSSIGCWCGGSVSLMFLRVGARPDRWVRVCTVRRQCNAFVNTHTHTHTHTCTHL